MLNRKYPTTAEIHKAEALGLVFDKTGRVLRLCTNKNISEVAIPDGVSTIGQNMQRPAEKRLIAAIFGDYSSIYDGFCNCVKLTTVVIPGSVKKITEGAFCNCKSLRKIVIPYGVKSIGENTFFECANLTEIDLPANITRIENGVFSGCTSLTRITIPASVVKISNSAFKGAGCEEQVKRDYPHLFE